MLIDPSVGIVPAEHEPVFLSAVKRGDFSAVCFMLKVGVNPNAMDRGTGRTAMVLACKHNHVDVAQLLLVRGASLEPSHPHKMTPLQHAIVTGNVDLVRVLRKLCTESATGALAHIHLAVSWSRENIVREYLNGRFLVNDDAFYRLAKSAIRRDDYDMLRVLIDRGFGVNTSPRGKHAPLVVAVRRISLRCVEALLAAGASVDEIDHEGLLPVHHAARSIPCLRALLSNSTADPGSKDARGNTALHVLARKGLHPDETLFLVEKGADVNATNDRRETPMHIACAGAREEFVVLLARLGARGDLVDKFGGTPGHSAARWCNNKALRGLAKTGWLDLTARDNDGCCVWNTPRFHPNGRRFRAYTVNQILTDRSFEGWIDPMKVQRDLCDRSA